MVASLLAAVGWRHYAAARPEYALSQIAVAIHRHDGTKLAYYTDAGAFADQIIDETVDWLVAQRGLDEMTEAWDVHEDGARAARVRSAKTALGIRLGRALATALTAGLSDSASVGAWVVDEFTDQAPVSDVLAGDHLDVRSAGPPEVDDAVATVPVTLRDRELIADITLTLVLHHDDARWRVVGVQGIARALATLDNAQLERIDIANRPREDALAALVGLGAPTVQRVAHGRSHTTLRLRIPLTNESSHPITSVVLGLSTRASDADHETVLSVEHAIPAGGRSTEVWEFDETAARGTHVAAMLTHPDRLIVHARCVVTDTDGQPDTLRLVRRYGELKSGTDEAGRIRRDG